MRRHRATRPICVDTFTLSIMYFVPFEPLACYENLRFCLEHSCQECEMQICGCVASERLGEVVI